MLTEKYKSLFDKHQINTPLRKQHFMAQIEHESGLKPISENLNYSKEGLMTVFKKYFLTESSTLGYVRNPQKIANKVYANRMGNGNEASGDGWKYRGRYFIQTTGKDNYKELQKVTGIDFENNPDSHLNEADSLIAALYFWSKNNLNALADKDDILTITKRINGGTNGIEHRKQLLTKYKNIIT